MRGSGGNPLVMGGAGGDTMQPEKPKGLLGFLGDEDKRARLAMALEGMTLNPNQGYMMMLGEGIKDRRTTKAADAAKNKTAAWLRSQGREDLAAAIEIGVMNGSDAAKMAMEKPDPLAQINLELKQLELQQARNPTPDPLVALEIEKRRLELEKMRTGGGSTEYGLSPQYGVDKDGNPTIIQIGKDGTAVQTRLPEGVTFQKEPIRIDAGTEWILLDPISRQPVGTIPKNLGAAAAETEQGKLRGQDTALLESQSSKMGGLEEVVRNLEVLADKATYTYAGQASDAVRKQLGAEPTESAIARSEYIAMVDNQVLPMLRDTFGAAFTVKEGETLRATLGDPNKSPAEKKAVLRAFIEQKRRDIQGLETRTGIDALGTPLAPQGGTRLKYNSQTGDFE
jgi:hypothetical protein